MAFVYQTFRKTTDPKTGKPGGYLLDKKGRKIPHELFRYRIFNHRGEWEACTGTSDEEATRKLAERRQVWENEIRENRAPAPKPSDTPWPFGTFGEEDDGSADTGAVREYLDWGKQQGGRHKNGWSEDLWYQRRRHLIWWKTRMDWQYMADVKREDVERTLSELAKEPARRQKRKDTTKAEAPATTKTPATVTDYGETMRAFFGWATDTKRYFERNELDKILKGMDSQPKNPHRELYPDELQRLLDAAPTERRLLYRVALATGYRAGECRSLHVCNLDPFGPALCLPKEATKNHKPARQFIEADLFAELKATSEGKPEDAPLLHVPNKETVYANIQRDFKKAKIARFVTLPDGRKAKASFHSLRVSFINAVVRSGADVRTIMDAARHSSAQMSLETYGKASPDRIREAVGAASKLALQSEEGVKQKVAVAGSDAEPELCTVDSTPSNPGGRAILQVVATQDKSLTTKELSPNPTGQARTLAGREKDRKTPLSSEEGVKYRIPLSSPDLQELAEMWDGLPEAVRAGMLATARAVAGATRGPKA